MADRALTKIDKKSTDEEALEAPGNTQALGALPSCWEAQGAVAVKMRSFDCASTALPPAGPMPQPHPTR